MRAAVCRTYGGPELIEIADVPVPTVGAGQVRVKVNVAAINFPDVLVIADTYQMSAATPFIPGSEFAGVVVQVSDGVEKVSVGDRVFGSTFIGAFAEEVVVASSAVTRIPNALDDRTAAAFGVTFKTAYHVLRSVALLQPGEELVVLGAGGGVGLAAVQLGVALGATVTAVASTQAKVEAAGAAGAKRLINYHERDLRQSLREIEEGVDVVVDPVGGDLAEPAMRSLGWGGRYVTVGYASGVIPRIPLNLVLLKGFRIAGFQFRDFATHSSDELIRNDKELMSLLESGRVTPHIGATFELDDASSALGYVADGHAIGKVILQIGDPESTGVKPT